MFQTRRWATAAAAGVSIGLPGLSVAATLNVPGDFSTIQSCINAAISGVDECVVAPATYHETINFLGKAITVRSSGRADVTTIDATGIGGSVVTCASGEGPDTVLDGFTIAGGTGTALLGVLTFGGGMLNIESSPTVTNCTFSGNTAFGGGGMYSNYSNATVTDCTFSGNTGAGMINDSSSPTVTSCTFSENTGTVGGGMYNYNSFPTLTNCTFRGNTADFGYGGGMFNDNSSPMVTNCTFIGNTATGGTEFTAGGGMFNDNSAPTVTYCTFIGNTATGDTEFTAGGGMYNTYGSSPTVANSKFSGNTANYAGGMVNGDNSLTVTNCTFSENTATYGGGMYNFAGGSPTVANSILWGDSPDEIVNIDGSAIPTIRFSDIHGGFPVGAINGGGNIYVNPMFMRPPDPGPDGTWGGVDDDYGNLRLRAGSPCIDTGDPAFVAQPGETDLEGHARVLCGRVDMGAYEFGIGDYDCDQSMDLTDFANWSACMTGPQGGPYEVGCEAFDFDGDGDVDLGDLASWQNAFNGS